jgi:hypothetical protein
MPVIGIVGWWIRGARQGGPARAFESTEVIVEPVVLFDNYDYMFDRASVFHSGRTCNIVSRIEDCATAASTSDRSVAVGEIRIRENQVVFRTRSGEGSAPLRFRMLAMVVRASSWPRFDNAP